MKNKLHKIKKICFSFFIFVFAFFSPLSFHEFHSPCIVFAEETPPPDDTTVTYSQDMVKFQEAADYFDNNITSVLIKLMRSAAYIMLIIGFGLFVLSYKNDDANSKEKAIISLAIAATIFCMDVFVFR